MLSEINNLLLDEIKAAKIKENPTDLIKFLVNCVMLEGNIVVNLPDLFPLNTLLEGSIFSQNDIGSIEFREEIIESYQYLLGKSDKSFFKDTLVFSNQEFAIYYESYLTEDKEPYGWIVLSISYTNSEEKIIKLGLVVTQDNMSNKILVGKLKYSPQEMMGMHRDTLKLVLAILS